MPGGMGGLEGAGQVGAPWVHRACGSWPCPLWGRGGGGGSTWAALCEGKLPSAPLLHPAHLPLSLMFVISVTGCVQVKDRPILPLPRSIQPACRGSVPWGRALLCWEEETPGMARGGLWGRSRKLCWTRKEGGGPVPERVGPEWFAISSLVERDKGKNWKNVQVWQVRGLLPLSDAVCWADLSQRPFLPRARRSCLFYGTAHSSVVNFQSPNSEGVIFLNKGQTILSFQKGKGLWLFCLHPVPQAQRRVWHIINANKYWWKERKNLGGIVWERAGREIHLLSR